MACDPGEGRSKRPTVGESKGRAQSETAAEAAVIVRSLMKRCTYCGEDYPDDALVCALDHNPLVAAQPPSSLQQNRGRFFNWRTTAALLWLTAVFFAGAGLLDLWLTQKLSTEANTHHSIWSLWLGAFENIAIGALCMIAWQLMRRRTSMRLSGGASVVGFALCGTMMRWIHWEIIGHNDLPWIEPLIVWPMFLYTIVYGYRESKLVKSVEQN